MLVLFFQKGNQGHGYRQKKSARSACREEGGLFGDDAGRELEPRCHHDQIFRFSEYENTA
jgi:hypothetical protein